jgi:hypothetical protein
MANRLLSRVRRETLAALLVAAGAVGTLTACSSNEPTTYRPQAGPTPVYQSPSYSSSQPAPAPTYTAPRPAPTYQAPPPAPAPSGGQMACGKGKCG